MSTGVCMRERDDDKYQYKKRSPSWYHSQHHKRVPERKTRREESDTSDRLYRKMSLYRLSPPSLHCPPRRSWFPVRKPHKH